ncbi:protein kinase domain-containing protein [Paraliomyxa miuraensis]|uniref:protein kinase domain-containing protein n=1 Tax=Paraliomyxa miuraensis TaxID=376150 RepID=UPI00225B2A90|nr:protein kinase [Paraliomyxa miuraensis]MCX4240149.1 protein kinase [Paraliomyxa miuraensis]
MQIGPYTLIRELGRGGMAQVWLAHRVWEDGERRPCVLKFPRRNAVTDEGMLRQFLEEWRLAIRLRHNNIVSVFDAGVHEGLPYLVMNYVAGKDLAEIIKTLSRLGKRFDVKTAVYVLRELGQGLLAAHEYDDQGVPQQIVHRDVASKNAMIDGWGGVLLMDFGVATSLMTQTSRVHVKGTLAYMAPEHYLGQASAASDIYGLGTVLWEMLAGRPFRGGLAGEELIAAIVAGTVEPVGRELPELVQQVLDGMLEPVAAKRMKLREVLVALEEFPSRRLLLQEMMTTYFGRAGKRTGLSSVHFAASKELTDTLAVVKVSGVSLSEIRRRKQRGQPREFPRGFVPERTDDTAKVEQQVLTNGADDLDEDMDGVPVLPAEVVWSEAERAEAERAAAEWAESEQAEAEREDDAAGAMTSRWRMPAGTERTPREPVPAAVAPPVEPTPGGTVRMEQPQPARAPMAAEATEQPATGEADEGGRVPPGDTLRTPGSGDPRPAPPATARLQTPVLADVEEAGRTEFLSPPVVEPVEPPPSSPSVREQPRVASRPARRTLPLLVVLAPLMLLALGTAWSLWQGGARNEGGRKAEPVASSMVVTNEAPAVVTAIADPARGAGLDSAEDMDEAPARPQGQQAPVSVAQPAPIDVPTFEPEPDPLDTTAPAPQPELLDAPAAEPVSPIAEPSAAVAPSPAPPAQPEPEPRPQPADAGKDTAVKKEPPPPKPVPKLELVVRRGLMVDHAEVRVDRGRMEFVPAKGWALFRVAPGTHTLRYRTQPDGEWKEKRHTFSANMAYSGYVELSGLRIDGAPAGGK